MDIKRGCGNNVFCNRKSCWKKNRMLANNNSIIRKLTAKFSEHQSDASDFAKQSGVVHCGVRGHARINDNDIST